MSWKGYASANDKKVIAIVVCKTIFKILWFVGLNVFYLKSLEKCPFGQELIDECPGFLKDNTAKWATQAFIAAMCLTYLLTTSKLTAVLASINFLILFFYDTGFDVTHHGGVNRVIFLTFTIVLLMMYGVST